MQVYRYYCRYRPPVPGSIPREGLTHVADFDYPQSFNGVTAHGWAEYSRPLTPREIDAYELTASPNNPLEY